MNQDWKEEELIKVTDFIDYRGKTPKKTESGVKLVTAKNVRMGYLKNDPEEFIAETAYEKWMTRGIPQKGDVLFTTEAPLANVALLNTEDKIALAQRIITLCPHRDILSGDYLTYCLQSPDIQFKILEKGTGATVTGIKSRVLKKVKIPIPPLPEQKRIVSILDEAFAAIDQAQANIERNIENAEELFQSKLNQIFKNKKDGWIDRNLSEVFKMKSGEQLSKKNIIPGPFPVYGGNGITGYHDDFNLKGKQILIGRVGAQCGNIHLTDEKIWLTDNAFRVEDLKFDFNYEFLEHLLRFVDLRKTARQSAQPVISNSSCKKVKLSFPEDNSDQKNIADRLNKLKIEVINLREVYKIKAKRLFELKKSLLQKAFSGELTAKEEITV